MTPTRLAILLLPLAGVPAAPACADDHAVIFIYHHVAEDTPSSTSITPARFAAQLDYLEANDYRVMPLDEVAGRLAAREPLPENTVAITFDDAYRSVYTTARPMLEIRNWPYTVFVSTAYIDEGYDGYMSWPQLREIAQQGAIIGNHGVRHASALAHGANEPREAWLERVRIDAVSAQDRISAATSTVPTLYAWPYGEYNADVERVIADLGWFAFGQQSGAAGFDSAMTAIPRYPQATGFDDMDSFILRARSEPLPIEITAAPERLLATGDPAPILTFRLDDRDYGIGGVNCFNSRGERLEMSRPGAATLRAQSATPLPRGRSKYTCTAPHRNKDGVFGWYSHLWVVR
ncbi:MAG TPA: polysaccharide deacetylase family protein [Woeseiaceae bacterium]|nr:polysaccharide deacetylase family protein [Woeseiaceae bacterium]